MRSSGFLRSLFLVFSGFSTLGDAARKPAESVLLSDVETLTLRSGLKTTHRRVSAVPQVSAFVSFSLNITN